MIFIRTLQKMLNLDLIRWSIATGIGLMKDEWSGKILAKFVISYLIDDGSKDKEGKGAKKCTMKKKLKFENYLNCLEATQLQNKINQLENSKIRKDSSKKDNKEFIRNNTLMLKTRQRFKSERSNVFTEETDKIALSSNDDKRMQ